MGVLRNPACVVFLLSLTTPLTTHPPTCVRGWPPPPPPPPSAVSPSRRSRGVDSVEMRASLQLRSNARLVRIKSEACRNHPPIAADCKPRKKKKERKKRKSSARLEKVEPEVRRGDIQPEVVLVDIPTGNLEVNSRRRWKSDGREPTGSKGRYQSNPKRDGRETEERRKRDGRECHRIGY